MTPHFDAYLMVDWSANNRPKIGRDSIWYCLLEGVDGIARRTVANPPTRQQAVAQLIAHLLELSERGKSTLIGFDFAYGYPCGFASALGLDLSAPWRAVWNWLTANMQDDERNHNNRFEVAAKINSAVSGTAYPFWGCPRSAVRPCLTINRGEGNGLPAFRITEQRQHGPQSVWKLCYPGAVGSQVLTGVPYLAKLRDHPILQSISTIWPFETGFTLPERTTEARIIHAEIYPSLHPAERLDGDCRDQSQVRSLAEHFAGEDDRGALALLFSRPSGLSPDQLAAVTKEEGWILGVR
jgi:precorrin-8X/cobalt-precorrin-8 methylmutase